MSRQGLKDEDRKRDILMKRARTGGAAGGFRGDGTTLARTQPLAIHSGCIATLP